MDVGSISIDSYFNYPNTDNNQRSDELKISDTLYFGRCGGERSSHPWIGRAEQPTVYGSIFYKPIIHPKLSLDHKTLELAQFGMEWKEDFALSYRYWLPETEKCCINDNIYRGKEQLLTAGISVTHDQERPLLFYFKLTPNWQAAADERVVDKLEQYDSGLCRCTFLQQGTYVNFKFGIDARQKPITEEEAREFAPANQAQFKDNLQELINKLMVRTTRKRN